MIRVAAVRERVDRVNLIFWNRDGSAMLPGYIAPVHER